MKGWKCIDRWFCKWFGHGEEKYEAEILFRKLVGLKHYWAEWKNTSTGPATRISSFVLWSIKADKYLKPRELAILLNLFTDLLGYDHEYEVDENEPYRQQEHYRTIRRTGKRDQHYLESYNLASPALVGALHNPVLDNQHKQLSSEQNDESGGPRPLTRAEIRRRRTRALGNR